MKYVLVFLKYVAAMIIFIISYMLCSLIAHIVLYIVNYFERGFWVDLAPYFTAFWAGVLSVYGGMYVVERFVPSVKKRAMFWLLFVTLGIPWGFAVFGLLLVLLGVIHVPTQEHTLFDPVKQAQALQAITALVTAWIVTSSGQEFEK